LFDHFLEEVQRDMTRRILAKVALAVCMAVVAALPAQAATIQVTALDGVNLSYTATEVGGVIDVNFNSLNLVSKVNGNVIVPLNATFSDLILVTGPVTAIPPPPNVMFNPAPVVNQYGIATLGGVVFDYVIGLGTTNSNNLSLTGVVFLDPASPASSFFDVVSGNTYDFSAFYAGPPGPSGSGPGQFFMSLNASVGDIIATLNAGNGTFAGSASFSQLLVPEPSSMVLLGIGGLVSVVARRRRKA